MSDSLPPGLGTPNYIPSLVNRVRTANPDLPIDSIVLQSLLLCLIARLPSLHTATSSVGVSTGVEQSQVDTGICAHLILRTTEEDIGLLANLVTLVSMYILIFNCSHVAVRRRVRCLGSPTLVSCVGHEFVMRLTRGKAQLTSQVHMYTTYLISILALV